jgi:hypothetical protein
MTFRTVCLGLSGAWLALEACAADGLQAPAAAIVWPQWQVRIGLQTANVAPLSLTAPFGPTRLGLGQASAAWPNGLALTADLGLVAEPAAATSGRPVFWNDSTDYKLREMHLSPLLKLGVRYAF